MSHRPMRSPGAPGEPIDRRTFVRRGAAAAAGLTVMSVPLLGCGSDSGSGGGGGAKRSVKFAAAKDPSMDPVKSDLIPQFTKETGIEVEYIETDWATMLQKIVRDAQNNTGVYDLEIVNDTWIPQMAGPDLLHDLGELGVTIDDDMFPAIAEELYWPRDNEPVPPSARGKEQKLVAGCIIGDVAGFLYRTDVFDEPPATWDELLGVVSESADPGQDRYGYVFPGSRSAGDPTWWLPILFGYGGQIMDDAWEPTFNQIELHPYLQQQTMRRVDRELGVATAAWSPLAQGAVLDDPVLGAIARTHGRSPAQVAVRWHLQIGNVVIPKSVAPRRLRENLDVLDFGLSDADMAAIAGLDRGLRTGLDPDAPV
jgi:hypothetical protein